jgi:hyperosmotically inducible periplasmic protein
MAFKLDFIESPFKKAKAEKTTNLVGKSINTNSVRQTRVSANTVAAVLHDRRCGMLQRASPKGSFMNRAILGVAALTAATFVGCSTTQQASDVTGNVRNSLKQAGFNDVSVKQDRDKGVVTLAGNVNTDADKTRAEGIAKPIVGNEVLADEINVVPPNVKSDAKAVNSDVDKAIDKNIDAVLIENGFRHGISHEVKSGVVTLKGTVDNDQERNQLAKAAGSVPNVRQVVNEIQTKHQKATSSD